MSKTAPSPVSAFLIFNQGRAEELSDFQRLPPLRRNGPHVLGEDEASPSATLTLHRRVHMHGVSVQYLPSVVWATAPEKD